MAAETAPPRWIATFTLLVQEHVQRFGPIPDNLGPDVRAAFAGDLDAMTRSAHALDDIQRADHHRGEG